MRRLFTITLVLVAAFVLVACQQAESTEAPVPTAAPPTQAEAEAVPTEVPAPAVTGTVTYLQRIALSPDSTVSVILYDVSRAGVSVVNEQQITNPGQVPIAFTLPYEPATIDPGHLYTVHAEIQDGTGSAIFVSTGIYPVITFDNPTQDVEVTVYPVSVVPPGEEPAPGTPPVVTVTLNPYEAEAGQDVDVYVHATATDGSGITKLELYVGDESTAEWTSETPEGEPWIHNTFVLRSVTPGDYEIRVKAIDSQGDEAWAETEKLTVAE